MHLSQEVGLRREARDHCGGGLAWRAEPRHPTEGWSSDEEAGLEGLGAYASRQGPKQHIVPILTSEEA